jgi:hypothetical protein
MKNANIVRTFIYSPLFRPAKVGLKAAIPQEEYDKF